MNTLITTVCSDNFIKGSMVLLSSLSKHLDNFENISVKVFYEDRLSPLSFRNQSKLKKICPQVQIEKVEESRYFYFDAPSYKRKAAYLTFEAFKQVEYDRVLFFDSDILVLNNISGLLNIECDMAASLAGRIYDDSRAIFYNKMPLINTGVLVLGSNVLKLEIYEGLMMDGMKLREKKENADQEVINGYFKDREIVFKALSYSWNWRYSLDKNIGDDVKILHFSGYNCPKPWVDSRPETSAYDLWDKEYREIVEGF